MGSNVKENSFQKNPLWSKLDSFSKTKPKLYYSTLFSWPEESFWRRHNLTFQYKSYDFEKTQYFVKENYFCVFSLWVETSGPRSAPGRTQPTPLVSWYLQGCSGRREVPNTVFRSYVKENSRKTLKKIQILTLGLRGPSGALPYPVWSVTLRW